MAIKALEGLTPYWFTPKSEKDNDDPTQFQLKPLNGEQYNYVFTELDHNEDGTSTVTGEGVKLALKYGLVGWKNFGNSSGDLDFTKANVKMIPFSTMLDLAIELIRASNNSGEQEKN